MKKAILISFTILISFCVISAQQIWKFDHKIQKNDYYRLSGKINDKYPIQMYLEKDTLLCGNPYDDDMNLTLKGWYYYEKIKTRIPLIGSCNKAEGREYVELFVPANPKDKINKSTCKLKDFSESFSNKKYFDLTNMEWKMKNSKVASKVKLKIDHESSPKTKLTIILQKNGTKLNEIDISTLSGANYLDEFNFFDTKYLQNFYYATFGFQEWSRQDDNANAMCGAGLERYLGYLKLDASGNIVDHKICLIESCWSYDKVEDLMIVPGHPEFGLVKSD